MNEALKLMLPSLAGIVIGLFFYGGLWWTLRKAMGSPAPGMWLLGSLLVRMPLALAGFYFVASLHWERMLACLFGFLLARLMVTRFTAAGSRPGHLAREGNHAPYTG